MFHEFWILWSINLFLFIFVEIREWLHSEHSWTALLVQKLLIFGDLLPTGDSWLLYVWLQFKYLSYHAFYVAYHLIVFLSSQLSWSCWWTQTGVSRHEQATRNDFWQHDSRLSVSMLKLIYLACLLVWSKWEHLPLSLQQCASIQHCSWDLRGWYNPAITYFLLVMPQMRLYSCINSHVGQRLKGK